MDMSTVLHPLKAEAQRVLPRAHVPYSGRAEAVVALLSDGTWIPGVRVENASFPLTLSATVNALTTMVALGRRDIVAMVHAAHFEPEDALIVGHLVPGANLIAPDFLAWGDDLPEPTHVCDPSVGYGAPSPQEGVVFAREIANRAHVPESNFPVGSVARLPDDMLIPGVNVEFKDWGRILCGERNALSTIVSYGLPKPIAMYLTCPTVPCSPCGACRQWLVELAPNVTVWMDQHHQPPISVLPPTLLPGYFSGESLAQSKTL